MSTTARNFSNGLEHWELPEGWELLEGWDEGSEARRRGWSSSVARLRMRGSRF